MSDFERTRMPRSILFYRKLDLEAKNQKTCNRHMGPGFRAKASQRKASRNVQVPETMTVRKFWDLGNLLQTSSNHLLPSDNGSLV